MASVKECEWKPPKERARKTPDGPKAKSISRKALESMTPGECLRFHHNDLTCGIGGCSLEALVSKMRANGMKLEIYHERPEGHERAYWAVIRRLPDRDVDPNQTTMPLG